MAILNLGSDRRASRRRTLAEIPEVTGVRVQSEDVAVVDASSEGILIQCSFRLPPGAASQLEILRTDGPIRVRGRVVRCEITSVSAEKLQYQVAIALNDRLEFIDADDESAQPDAATTATDATVPALASAQAPKLVDVQVPPVSGDASELESALALNAW